MRKDYFEGILQLRNPSYELLNFVRNKIKKDNKAFIAKEEHVKGGIDIYLSSQHYLQNIGKVLKKHVPGELKISQSLYSQSHITSKSVYRINVLFRLSNLKKGQKLIHLGREYKILSLGKKVILQDISSGKRKSLNYASLHQS